MEVGDAECGRLDHYTANKWGLGMESWESDLVLKKPWALIYLPHSDSLPHSQTSVFMAQPAGGHVFV